MTTIAKKMNECGIKSPEYYQRRKLADWKPDISKKYLWVQTSVKRILTNELYIGTMVNHKTVTSKIYKTKTFTEKDEQYRHENFCEPIIDMETWEQAQFLLAQRAEIKPRSQSGKKMHRYSGIIKCAECGASLIARTRKWHGKEYVEYTCNSNHRYGKQYCTPHTVREQQLDELVADEFRHWQSRIIEESVRYEKVVKDWIKRKPMYDRQIEQHEQRIAVLKAQIERMNDRERWEVFNSMIEKREAEIRNLEKQISDLHEYGKVCKQRKEQLSNTAALLETVLSEGTISDISLRMLVKRVTIHQNEDKSLEIAFEMNGDFEASASAILTPSDDDEKLPADDLPDEFYDAIICTNVS